MKSEFDGRKVNIRNETNDSDTLIYKGLLVVTNMPAPYIN